MRSCAPRLLPADLMPAATFPRSRVARGSFAATLVLLTGLYSAATVARAGSPDDPLVLSGTWEGDFSIPAFDGPVSSCAILNGAFIVAGDFHWAGDVAVDNVAIWNGAAWSELGMGMATRVRKLAISSSGE